MVGYENYLQSTPDINSDLQPFRGNRRFELSRIKLYRQWPEGKWKYFELAGGSSSARVLLSTVSNFHIICTTIHCIQNRKVYVHAPQELIPSRNVHSEMCKFTWMILKYIGVHGFVDLSGPLEIVLGPFGLGHIYFSHNHTPWEFGPLDPPPLEFSVTLQGGIDISGTTHHYTPTLSHLLPFLTAW